MRILNSDHSVFDPAGPKSDFVAAAWWILFGVAVFVCVVVILLAVGALFARRRACRVSDSDAKGFVMSFGVIIPALVLGGTFALSVVGIAKDAAPARPTEVTVEVVGHRWWWEVRYPDREIVTANEIHVPVDTPVRLRLTSADVIHSFWVPAIMPKLDAIPGHSNETWLTVDETGTFRGQCAEFCGIQHTHMGFSVVAQPREEFRRWLDEASQDARAPVTAEQRRGYDLVTDGSCASCHTVRGTPADGDVGPDLTHIAARDELGAGTVPNDREHLRAWIDDTHRLKPGAEMPPQPLSPTELDAVVAYLQRLR